MVLKEQDNSSRPLPTALFQEHDLRRTARAQNCWLAGQTLTGRPPLACSMTGKVVCKAKIEWWLSRDTERTKMADGRRASLVKRPVSYCISVVQASVVRMCAAQIKPRLAGPLDSGIPPSLALNVGHELLPFYRSQNQPADGVSLQNRDAFISHIIIGRLKESQQW